LAPAPRRPRRPAAPDPARPPPSLRHWHAADDGIYVVDPAGTKQARQALLEQGHAGRDAVGVSVGTGGGQVIARGARQPLLDQGHAVRDAVGISVGTEGVQVIARLNGEELNIEAVGALLSA